MENTNVIEASAVHPATQMNLATVLRIPVVRQITLLVGVAVAVAVGFAIVLWSQAPSYTALYSDMSAAESAEVADTLRTTGIDFKVDAATGTVLVAEDSLHEARMQLASQGLPQSISAGMDSMSEQSSFGVSQFMESARYQHALEAELARTISTLGAVREARVHLAMPKQSAFIRNQRGATASVVLQLFRGRTLEGEQATAIANLVAGSVPNLAAGDVTLLDQYGRQLNSGGDAAAEAQAMTQLKYKRQLEEDYKQRIEDLLTSIVGPGRVRATVDVDVDFTVSEETRESFDPARAVVRSEQTSEERRGASDTPAAGVPGALSNQPPEATGGTGVPSEGETVATQNESRMTTRNFEVDRTISHTRPQSGTIRRLSIAVVVDDSPFASVAEGEAAAGGAATPAVVTAEDIARYETLVREAVGFDAARGDSVTVMSETFRSVEPMEAAEPPPIWKQPLFREMTRQALGVVLVLAIAFGVVRPMLRSVVSGNASAGGEYIGASAVAGGGIAAPHLAAAGAAAPAALTGPNYEEKVAAAKNITGHDPARVAQVVKKWVTIDE
ncbi:MAG: flagellar basal-body MS-ring/collar protein FliF [Woeseiaceae bacterium]|nr:flagellar basal-body MS-ring/collar protein FliF [Woeseiaceae bacterium]